MAEKKILGQLAPPAAAAQPVYVVPSGRCATISTINVCNFGGAADSFRLWTVKAGAGVSNDAIIYWDVVASLGNNTFQTTAGITLGPGEAVYCYATNGTSAFNVYGKEETQG